MEMRLKNVEANADTFLLKAHWNVRHIGITENNQQIAGHNLQPTPHLPTHQI